GLSRPPPLFINEGVAEDGEQPPLGVGAALELVPGAIRLEHRFLDEVVGLGRVPREPQCDAVQAIEVDQGFTLEARTLLGIGCLTSRGGSWRGRWDGRRVRCHSVT